jgi:outer membrane immunogenic protein
MKKFVLSVALTTAFATSAFAADLAVKSRPMAPAPIPYAASWTGCYVGAGGGYGMYNQETTTLAATTAGGFTASLPVTNGGRGWFGTVQVGCDYQFADRWVIGAFGDYDWSGLKGNTTWARGGATIVAEEKQKSTWAAGGRLGYVVVPQLLAYVSGGYTEARFGEMNPLLFAFGGATSTNFLPATTYKGWFIGTGYEYGVSFLPGLFWKTEYRYSDFRAQDIPFTVVGTGVATGDLLSSRKFEQTIRSELVYRFNFGGGGGPVVARY